MESSVIIKYLQVLNPKTDVSISLIPWFLLSGRPYPVFIYIYANWHYESFGKKSMKQSAIATGKGKEPKKT
jgi:hypothetical protein